MLQARRCRASRTEAEGESARNRAELAGIFRCSSGVRVTVHAPGAQKIRRPSSGGGKFRGDFSFERSLSRTSTLVGQGTLPSPTTGCRIRFSESLLMLGMTYTHQSLVVKCCAGHAIGVERPPVAYRQTPPLPFLNPQPKKSVVLDPAAASLRRVHR
jgi:hypothetical protein